MKCMVPKAARTATKMGTIVKPAVRGFRKTKKRTTAMVNALMIIDFENPVLTAWSQA